jgi:hypothetical protein
LPIRRFCGGAEDCHQPRISKVTQTILDGIGFDARRELVHETFVRKRVLQSIW